MRSVREATLIIAHIDLYISYKHNMPRSGPITEGHRRAALYNRRMFQDALPMTTVQNMDTLTHQNFSSGHDNWVRYNTTWLDMYLKRDDAFEGFFDSF